MSSSDAPLGEPGASASDIERWWQEGRTAADSEYSIGTCPYAPFSVAWLWWVRGYSRQDPSLITPRRRRK